MKIIYGLAEYDRFMGTVDFNVNLPMEGVESNSFYEFLKQAGEQGWELCASFSSSDKGKRRAIPAGFGMPSGTRTSEDAAEEISMIFKKRG